MKIKKAIEKAGQEDAIRDILENDGFFCSGFITLSEKDEIEKWNLSFYCPEDNKITPAVVTETGVSVGEKDEPLHKEVPNPDENKIKVDAKEALEKAKKEFGKFKMPLAKILVSFQKKGTEFWSISFITKLGSIINIKIDPEDGKIIEKEHVNLLQNYKAK